MPSWHRMWFCISEGKLWLTPQYRCKGWERPGCGVCNMGGHRKEALVVALREYMKAYQPSLNVCAPVGCRDMPMFETSVAGSSLGRHGSSKTLSAEMGARDHPRFALSYVGSLHSVDVPFPDYTLWRVPGSNAGWEESSRQLTENPVPWEHKHDRAILAFGFPLHRNWYRPNPSATLPLRHALYFGRCGQVSGGRIAVAHGPPGASDLPFVNKTAFCAYKYILLTHGTSNWLNHFQDALLCGSLVIFVHDDASPSPGSTYVNGSSRRGGSRTEQTAFGVLSRLMRPDVNYVLVRADSKVADVNSTTREALCARLGAIVEWARRNEALAANIAREGQRLVQRAYRMPQVLAYMHGVLGELASHQSASVVRKFRSAMHGAAVTVRALANSSCIRRLVRLENISEAFDSAAIQRKSEHLRAYCDVVDEWSASVVAMTKADEAAYGKKMALLAQRSG